MEVGAVKQAFNNEVILLKKNLNQAKIQIIHKLTRKAKTLTEKKVPEKLKAKFTKKAESAVKEVLILKKIKARDVGRFIVTHKGQLNEYLNKPIVDKDKACARLLLHKALQGKYKVMRDKFSNIPIEDLLMSRQERLKRKKEARENQKNKKKGKEGGPIQAEGNWDVEDIDMGNIKVRNESDDDSESSNDEHSQQDESEGEEEGSGDERVSDADDSNNSDDNGDEPYDKHLSIDRVTDDSKKESAESSEEEVSDDESSDEKTDSVGKFVKFTPTLPDSNVLMSNKPVEKIVKIKENISNKKVNERHKDHNTNKNKNLKNKILMKKFNKDKSEVAVQENKVVDPFFITATGENYLSLAEPRQPDEVKEEHRQGNRQYRRAVMFGHVPKPKPQRNNFRPNNSDTKFSKFSNGESRGNFNKNFKSNGFEKNGPERFRKSGDFNNKSNFNDKSSDEPPKPEKLHPSWEAKKRQSGILPFQGKKIVFDEG